MVHHAAKQPKLQPALHRSAEEETLHHDYTGQTVSHYASSASAPPPVTPGTLMRLQSLIGNSAVQRMLNRKKSGTPDIQRRQATWLERRAWLSFFSHYLPRMLLNHYMDDTGTTLTLTEQQMVDCNAVVDIRRSAAFRTQLAALRAAGGGTAAFTGTGASGALTNGTLGNFTVNYNGTLTVAADGTWRFTGTMTFYDYWDFDPKPFDSNSNRPVPAEIKVRVAHYGMPGQPFAINSASTAITQTEGQTRATWAGQAAQHVPDAAGRTMVDIGAGDVAGGEFGPEIGTQSSEDLN